jgi:hypothetical protein
VNDVCLTSDNKWIISVSNVSVMHEIKFVESEFFLFLFSRIVIFDYGILKIVIK